MTTPQTVYDNYVNEYGAPPKDANELMQYAKKSGNKLNVIKATLIINKNAKNIRHKNCHNSAVKILKEPRGATASKLSIFQNSQLGVKHENKLKESKAKTNIPQTIQIPTRDDEKIDEYMVWTQYIDKNKRKPTCALELCAFVNQNNNASINMFKAKTILQKYKDTNYQPVYRSIPKKKIITVQSSTKTIATTSTHKLSDKDSAFFNGKCQICLEDKENILTTNKCRHNLCKDCMRMYIKSAPNKLQIKCPEFKCSSLLSQYFDIKCVLSHNEYSEMYLKKLLNKLSHNQGDQMCFTKTCFNKISLNDIINGKFECFQCNESWCIHCKSAWHEGVNCEQSKDHQKNTLSDLLLNCAVKTIGYVSGVPEMRACVTCHVPITHTNGCKHMYCIKCNTSFCFVCLEVYDATEGWKCGGSSDICPIAPRQIVQNQLDNKQQCQNCGILKTGKIDEKNGLFYCDFCWIGYQ